MRRDILASCGMVLRYLGYRVYSSIPGDPEWPIIVMKRIGGSPIARQGIETAQIQFDVWGGAPGDKQQPQITKSDVRDLAAQARVELLKMEGAVVTDGDELRTFITGVDDALGMTWLPDPDSGRDRYMFSLWIYGRIA